MCEPDRFTREENTKSKYVPTFFLVVLKFQDLNLEITGIKNILKDKRKQSHNFLYMNKKYRILRENEEAENLITAKTSLNSSYPVMKIASLLLTACAHNSKTDLSYTD